MQSVPIITNVVSLHPANGKVYSIQHYVIKFVSDLQQIGGFLWVLRFPSPIKLTAAIIEILLKMALNTINQTKPLAYLFSFLCCVFLFSLSLFYVLCIQCCPCFWAVHSWLPKWFSLTFILKNISGENENFPKPSSKDELRAFDDEVFISGTRSVQVNLKNRGRTRSIPDLSTLRKKQKGITYDLQFIKLFHTVQTTSVM